MKTRFFFITAFYALSFNFFAQNNLFGTVTDQSGNPIPGTSITFEGGDYGTYTDRNGSFKINNIPSQLLVLLFEAPGLFLQKKKSNLLILIVLFKLHCIPIQKTWRKFRFYQLVLLSKQHLRRL